MVYGPKLFRPGFEKGGGREKGEKKGKQEKEGEEEEREREKGLRNRKARIKGQRTPIYLRHPDQTMYTTISSVHHCSCEHFAFA